MLQDIMLTTKRLLIRDHKISDLNTHHQLLTNAKTMHYLKDIMTYTLEESRENLKISIQEIDNPERTKYFLRIEDKVTKEHIGEIGYTVIQFTPAGKVVQLGYFSYDKFWGKGYITEAVKELIRFAFEENDVIRIGSGCLKENVGSEKIMQKCGMVKEAEHHFNEWHNDRLKDRVEYRLLKEEWLNNKSQTT